MVSLRRRTFIAKTGTVLKVDNLEGWSHRRDSFVLSQAFTEILDCAKCHIKHLHNQRTLSSEACTVGAQRHGPNTLAVVDTVLGYQGPFQDRGLPPPPRACSVTANGLLLSPSTLVLCWKTLPCPRWLLFAGFYPVTINARFKGPALWCHWGHILRAILTVASTLQALTSTGLTNGLQGVQASLPGKPAGDQRPMRQRGRVIGNEDAEGSGSL